MAIVGGAALPVMAGKVADLSGALAPAFVVPMAGYVGVALFAIAAARARPRLMDAETPVVAGH
jgi:FHS family L-fucose permease-like MFS transporter